MALGSFWSRLYTLLAGVAFLCSSCFAPDRLSQFASQPVAEDDALSRQAAVQPAFVPAYSPDTKATGPHRDMYGALPLSFETNHGQTAPQVKFLSHGPGYALFLTANEAVLALQNGAERGQLDGERKSTHPPSGPPTVIRMRVLDAAPTPVIVGAEQLPGKVSYLRGSDPALWRTNIPTYGKIRYQNMYPGIDLVYYGRQRQLEYDFVVAPGSTPSTVRLAFTDETGRPLPRTLDSRGNLILHTPTGNVHLHKPFVYQDNNGTRTEVTGSYVQHGPTVGFEVASYDESKPLVIDPKLTVYSTFLGGDGRDSAFALALDGDHNVYLAGQTLSANFPLATGAVDATADVNNGDAFVAKLDATGSTLLYSTYLGGPGADVAKAIAVDSEGNAYIAGETLAPDQLMPVFPTTPDAVQPTAGGGVSDAFVAKLDPTGSTLLYSTYLGGAAADRANGLAVDSTGSAYVVGVTLSDFFLSRSGINTMFGSGPIAPDNNTALPQDAFVVKLNADGSRRQYTAVFSARAYEEATAIAVNAEGEAYVVGTTSSSDFPVTPNSLRIRDVDGSSNAFVSKLNATGTQILYSTELGGLKGTIVDPQGEAAFAVAIDAAGDAVVTGVTRSPSFPTIDQALVSALRGVQDGFLTILDVKAPVPTDDKDPEPLYSTYLGGSNILRASGLAVESFATRGTDRDVIQSVVAYVAGTTGPAFSPSLCAVQPIYGGGPSDTFLFKMVINFKAPDDKGEVKPNDAGVRYSTYLGGSERDEAYAFALDSDRNMYIAGFTRSPSFPVTPDSLQASLKGEEDAFVTKIDSLSNAPCTDLRLSMTDEPDPIAVGGTITYSLAVSNIGPDLATNVIVTDTLPAGVTLTNVTPSVGSCTGTSTITCELGTLPSTQTERITIVGVATAPGNPVNRATVTASSPEVEENNNTAAVNTTVVGGNQLSVTLSQETGASGQVTSRPEGIACPPDCAEVFPPGTPVILTATPDAATSSFRRWGGACSGAGTTPFCDLTINGDLTAEADFAQATGLAGDWVGLTQTCSVSGKKQQPRCRVNGTLKVTNSGPVRAPKFTVRFFFSDDPALNAGYVVLKDKKVSGLAADSEQLIQVDLRLPTGVSGSGKFVVAYVDADAQVPEGDEANNRAVFGPLP